MPDFRIHREFRIGMPKFFQVCDHFLAFIQGHHVVLAAMKSPHAESAQRCTFDPTSIVNLYEITAAAPNR